MPTLICHTCGREYKRTPSQIRRGSSCCSRKCLATYLASTQKGKHKAPWRTRLNQTPGRNARIARQTARKRSLSAARTRAKKKDHKRPRSRGKFEHREILKRIAIVQGKTVGYRQYVVHHADEDPSNNSDSNLSFLSGPAEHGRIHGYLRRETAPTLMTIRRKGKRGRRYKFKTRPYRHQVKALNKLLAKSCGALFMDAGTGKTKVAIDYAACEFLRKGWTRVVVICPKKVRPVWRIELRKHLEGRYIGQIDYRIYHYQELVTFDYYDEETGETWESEGVLEELVEWEPDIVFVDESHRAGNPTSKQTKALFRLCANSKATVVMTGTKTGGKVLKLWSQYHLVKPGILGSSFSQYKKRIALWNGYKLVKYMNLDWQKKRVAPYTYEVKKEECLDLPPKTFIRVPIELSKRTAKLYREITFDGYTRFGKDELVADNPLAKLVRQRQLESGLFRTEGGVKRVSHEKYDQLVDDLSDYYEEEEKIVVIGTFLPSLVNIGKAAKKAGYRKVRFLHGATSEQQQEQDLLEFDESSEPMVYVIQSESGGLGITLTAAKNAIYYEVPTPFISWSQTQDRLHRIGQHWPVTYKLYMPETKGLVTASQLTYLALAKSQNVEDWVLRNPELLMKEAV